MLGVIIPSGVMAYGCRVRKAEMMERYAFGLSWADLSRRFPALSGTASINSV